MAIKRFIETRFWFDQLVLDTYSPQDKLFSIYLRTNPHTSQLGIYALPKRTMSFELGYSAETIGELLDRFQTKYHDIVYSEATQEVAVLGYLKFGVLKGGKPVLDLLRRELEDVIDVQLIQSTYEVVRDYLSQSTREVDHQILVLIEDEFVRRGIQTRLENDNKNNNENQNNNQNENKIYNNNNNKRSSVRYPDHRPHDENVSATKVNVPTTQRLVHTAYQLAFDHITPDIQQSLDIWTEKLGAQRVQAAIQQARKNKATNPIKYIVSVCHSWAQAAQ